MLTALDQLYSVSSLICINGAFNLVFTSTMYQICTKIRILKHRFKVIIQQLEHNGEIDNNDNKNIRDVMRKNDAMTDKIESQLIANWVESHIALIKLSQFIYF